MADENLGKLTQEQRVAIQEWIDKTLAGRVPICPLCQTSSWDLVPHLMEQRVYVGGNLNLGAVVYPAFALMCSHCKYMATINAVSTGVLTGPAKAEEAGGAEKEGSDGK
jgi:hypothetical protein